GCSRAQGPSGASPARFSARRTPGATDNTSPHSPRSGGLHPRCSGPARPEHRPAAASRRSLQACIASLPLQSSWMSKTYLKSDHFNGGGSQAPPKLLGVVSPSAPITLESERESRETRLQNSTANLWLARRIWSHRFGTTYDHGLKVGSNVRACEGYMAGTVKERLDDLHAMYRDPEVQWVIASRGGRSA